MKSGPKSCIGITDIALLWVVAYERVHSTCKLIYTRIRSSRDTDSRNQDQRPGWPNPMSRNPCLLTQQSTRPIARGVFPAKIAILDLKTLKEKDSKEVVQNLNEGMARLKFFLRSEEEQHNSDEFIYDLTCTLAKACRAPSGENTNKILAALKGSVFLSKKIPRLLDRVQASTALNDQVSRQRLIQCLIEVFIKYLMHLPSSYIDLPYVHLKEALHQSSIDKKEELQKELDAFKQARDDIIKSERQKHSKRFINRVGEKPPNDFRDIPICPTNKEVTTQERPFLRKNISKGRYEDAEHYLDVQFRLLREDFLEPLREGIHEIVLNIPRPQRKQLMKNYSSVQILSKEFTWSGVIHQVQINGVVTSGWGNSKRLLFGSFLCLSNDNFKTMFFATVSGRDLEQLKNGRIDIQFLEEQDVLGIESRDCVYQMVESPAYFEAYRHVLKGLKQLDETTLPFKKYLVECSKEVDPPEYLRRDDTEKPVCYDLSNALDVPDVSNVRAVPVLQLTAWPSVKTLPLNSSQLEALRTAITTEFSVIQGPPGTGKTYVGAKIVKCLLENRDAWDPDPDGTSPMLMVCYTNHALDQFLEKVLEFRKKEEVIRVGGRCKSQIVEACNLKHLTGEYRLNEKSREVKWKMRQNQQEMKEWKKHLTKVDSELLEFDDLEALLSPEHANQLYNAIFPSNVAIECRIPGNTFKLWLCNDERVGSCNKSATGEEEDQNERRPDRSILAESGAYLDDEGFNYASFFKEPHDVDENNIYKTLIRETRDALDVSKEINKNRLEPKELFSEQQELKENSHHCTLLTSASFQQSSCSVEKCTHSPNVFAYGKQLDEIGDADKETIEIERETDLLQHQRWIQGDEDILGQERDQEGANKGNDNGWMTLTNRNKGKPFPWLKAKGENSKTESKGNQVLNAENEDHTGKTNSSENSMKKRNRASFDVKRELDCTPFGTVELTEVADNIEMTKNIRTESQHSGEKDEDISEVDEKTNAIEKEADLVQHQTRIQDDNDFLLPILEETGDLLNQAQNQGGKNEENDDEWINLITGTRGKKFFWLNTENENSKEENAGVQVLDAENEDETGKKKSSKKKKKKKKINRASLDVEHELDCTPMKMVGLREVADNIKITENSQTDNEHSGEKKDDDVSEAVEKNIAFEREADLIQQQRRIQGDEELLLVISEETGELLSQEQDQGGANVEIDDQWTTTTLTNRKKGKAFPWLKKESESCKDERPGIQVLKAENENETGKTNSPKRRKKKGKKENGTRLNVEGELDCAMSKIEVADNKSEETENPQRENEISSEKAEDVRETDKETIVIETEADLLQHQRWIQGDVKRELDCTPFVTVGLTEVADIITMTENIRTENQHSGEKDEDISEVDEETIAIEKKADLVQQQTRIQDDNDLLLPILEETGDLLNQAQNQGEKNEENDNKWINFNTGTRGKKNFWLNTENENSKEKNAGVQVLDAENEDETGQKKSSKKKKKKKKINRASLDVEHELDCTPMKMVGLREVADNIKITENSQTDNEHGGEKKDDDVSEAVEENIAFEREADLIQQQRRIQGDEELLLVISEETGELLSREQDQGGANVEIDDQWTTTTLTNRKKGKAFPWLKKESESCKDERPGIQVLKAENENETGKTNSPKKRKKKRKKKIEVADNKSEETENPQRENEFSSEKTEDVRETDKETFVVDLTKHQRRVQSNEHQLPITVQKGNILSEEHDHGETNKANDEGWKLVIHKKKGKPFPWVKSEAANSKEITCVKELDQNKTGKTNPSKKTKGINITGNISSLKEQLKKEGMMSTEEAMGVDNIWSLSPSDRLRLYLFWIENYRERYRVEIYRSEQEYKQLCEELEAVRFEEEEKVIRQATVVGMTTSGAARYHSILQRIAPKIVVIEEAAEVMEAHIITSLSHNTKHAILIGDHKQLRPKATVYELARNYNLEVSLFERMVMNSMDCKRLSIQHRMRPEIAALTKRIYDHEIIDHESVCHFRDINGVCHNLFFVDHFHPESLMGGLQSYSNHHEAEFLVALCNYLLLQGYEGKQITILTMYTGQLLLLQQKMPREAFEGVKICAVDNFQGEENDIILLSLVRSNSEGRIGFLGESNRICVALSRARKGFYCIGNFSLLTSQSKLWKEICDDLKTKDAIGDSLQLVCKRHSNVTSIRWASDFSYSQLGGCTMSCGERLDCGHACNRPCHASDEYHEKGHCSKMCINLCPNNHKCPRRCHYPKECKCYEFVLKTLPLCGHEQPVQCSIDPKDVPCQFKCEKTLKCGHNCQKPCGKICTKRCTVSCTKTLPCGHEKSMLCYKDPMVHYQCNSSCAKVLECGHPCSKRCTDTCQCDTEVEAQLPCEHRIQVLCREKDNPVQCKERCKRTLDCGHDCPGICHEECRTQECRIVVFKELPCGHQQSVSCFQDPQTAFCFAPCPRQLNCGHMCSSVCGRLCHEVQCKEFCQKKCERGHSCQKRCHFASSCDDCMVEVNMMIPLCGHSIKTPCYVDPATLRCKQRCERVRVCGHSCEEICSKNCEARPCKVPTPRLLSCNHVMTLACHKNPEKFICEKVVKVKLSCGHKTSLKCHVKKAALERVLCKEQMEKELRCGHKLTLPCFKNPEDCICRNKVNVELPCGHTKFVQCSTVTAGLQNVSCTVKIKRKLPCDHEVTLPCHIKLKEHCCQEEVEITLLCGHSKLTTCSNKEGELQNGMCKIKVTRKLPCGHEKVMQCSDRPDKIFCDAPCEHFFPCGHPCPNKCGDDCAVKCTVEVKKALRCGYHNVSCLCSEDVSQLICSNQCTRKLMCGHLCPGKCFQRCNKYKCQKWVNKSLNCAGNHSLRMHCKDDPNCVPCQERCTRKLDCDHPCPGLCSEPCDSVECRRRIKKIHPCGHEEEIWCFQRKAATCKAPCRRQGSCKHMCKGVCGEPCSKFPCKEAVCKTLRCGHKVMMPCSYSVDDVQCPASCGAKLQCGHQCSGICDECKQRGSHEMCQNPCNRLLVCSHRCQATCSEPCPPCNRNCDRRCPHGKCKQRCSQLCEPCKQPCKWNCFHYQCKNLCEEECDRPRCDAACPKKLPCRHPCIGLCGENCPTVCAICHAKKLLSMLGHGSDKATEASRYLQLFDCGHVVSVKEMDAWMFRERGSDVQLIRCPRCSTSITFSYRYGNIIKRTLKNIENVKKQIRELGNEKAGYSSNLLKKLRHRPKGLLAVVEKLSKRPRSMALDKVPVSNIPFVFTLRNNLLVLHQVEKAHHILQNVEGRKENSKEQLQITEHSRTIKDALESISKFLNKPQLDLTTLNQMHEHTRKFTLFAFILESQCEAIKHQISFSRNGKTCLQSAQKRFHLFIQGHNDALHIDWLENIVALLRKEVGLTSVPPEEPKVFENFPGFNKGVWKLCKEHRQVYLTRSLMRNGEDATEMSGCGQCVDLGNSEEGAVGWSFFNFLARHTSKVLNCKP